MKPGKGRITTMIAMAIVLSIAPGARAESQFPLKSISPHTMPPGTYQVRFGVDYSEGERLLFQTTDMDREVFQAPSFDLELGVSQRVELLFSYPLVFLRERSESWDYGSGDIRVSGVFNLLKERKIFPEFAVKLSAKLPNADDMAGFGTDQTDFFAGGLFEKRLGKLKVLVNAELVILGNPASVDTEQDDVLQYSIGLFHPLGEGVSAGLELYGTAFSRAYNERRFIRAGLALGRQKFLFDAWGAAGLNEESGDFQAGVGISYRFGMQRQVCECPTGGGGRDVNESTGG